MRALDQLMAAVTMQPQRKTIDLPNGDVFEFWMTPLTLAERTRAQKQAKSAELSSQVLHGESIKGKRAGLQLLE